MFLNWKLREHCAIDSQDHLLSLFQAKGFSFHQKFSALHTEHKIHVYFLPRRKPAHGLCFCRSLSLRLRFFLHIIDMCIETKKCQPSFKSPKVVGSTNLKPIQSVKT